MKKRRQDYYYDIEPKEIYLAPTAVIIVVLMLFLFASFLVYLENGNEVKRQLEHNAQAEIFNSRPLAEREIIASYVGEEIDGENYTIILQEITVPGVWFPCASLICLLVEVIVFSLVASWMYYKNYDEDYYFADLPLCRPYGWVLLFSMFAIWPFLLILSIPLRRYIIHQRQDENDKTVVTEKINGVVFSSRKLTEEDVRETYQTEFRPNDRKDFIARRVADGPQAIEHEKKLVNEDIECLQGKIQNLGKEIQKLQHNIGDKRAELKRLESIELSPNDDRRERAAEEWEMISKMRGVSSIAVVDSSIDIIVKVRVLYQQAIYDFGDYRISINPIRRTYRCVNVRSGVKPDATSRNPDYSNGYGGMFCFGSRGDTISHYLQHARMLEAITLIVDCLHSVNSSAKGDIPNCFRCISVYLPKSEIRQKQKKLQRKRRNRRKRRMRKS